MTARLRAWFRNSWLLALRIASFLFAWAVCPDISLSFLTWLSMNFAGIMWRTVFNKDFAISLFLLEDSMLNSEAAASGESFLSHHMFRFVFWHRT